MTSKRTVSQTLSRTDRALPLCGIAIGNSVDFVVALLAAWKCGMAAAPIDPSWPVKRLNAAHEGCPFDVILTTGEDRDRLQAALPAVEIITVDGQTLLCEDAFAPTDDLEPVCDNDVAYVIFTSGTTGEPKGVPITHANLAQLLAWQDIEFDLGSHYSSVQILSVSFDFGFEEVLNQVCFGGRVHFATKEESLDADSFRSISSSIGANLLYATPSQLKLLLPGLDLDTYRLMLIGGEVFPWALWDQLQPIFDSCNIFNGYGPTEATITSTTHRLQHSDRTAYELSNSVPIGTPCSETKVYVGDADGSLSPNGVEGELFIGGGGVSPGYLNKGASAATRFAANPFDLEDPCKIFRTGDMARRLHDGSIEFLGRKDHQVKIAGYRIEMDEIACVLASQSIEQFALDVIADETGNSKIVAYCKLAEDDQRSVLSIRESCGLTLPAYMIPQIILVGDIPLNHNGKQDLTALRRKAALAKPKFSSVGAHGSEEELCDRICEIWRDFLGNANLSHSDNVFDHGANSLLILQAKQKFESVLEREISISQMFENPTSAALARTLFHDPTERAESRSTMRRDRAKDRFSALRRRSAGQSAG